MKITLKDGSVKEYSEAKSVYDIAKDISEGLARVACAGEVNGEIVDLRTELSEDCELNIVTANDPEGLKVIRHTASHVLAQAVKRLFPNAKVTIGPAIEDGFYYDFDAEPFSREDLDNLEAEVQNMLAQVYEELCARARVNLEEKTHDAHSYEEFMDIAENKPGFIRAMWCGEAECEDKLKEETGGVKSRCIPFHEDKLGDTCVCCGKPAKKMVYWAIAY